MAEDGKTAAFAKRVRGKSRVFLCPGLQENVPEAFPQESRPGNRAEFSARSASYMRISRFFGVFLTILI
jgi:hypothetical protein